MRCPDEDADDDPLLSIEADVCTPPETNAIDLMQDDLLKDIIDDNSENDCRTSAEDTVSQVKISPQVNGDHTSRSEQAAGRH